MAAKKTKAPKGQFAFNSKLSDVDFSPGEVEKQDRKLEKELFGPKGKLDQFIDTYEERLGIKPSASKQAADYESRAKVFDFEDMQDVDLFKDLMNKPQYNIIFFDKNWTVQGTLKLFIIYQIDKNFKPPKVEITNE